MVEILIWLAMLNQQPQVPEPDVHLIQEHVASVQPDPEPSEPEVDTQETPTGQPATSPVWDALAACESNGEWDYGPGSGWGSGLFEGGLQFHPDTWDAYRPAGYPDAAYMATRQQQIDVAEMVLRQQGWVAWPSCSKKLGLR